MTSGDLTVCHDLLTEPCLFSYFICSGATSIACNKEHRLTNLSFSPGVVSKQKSQTEEAGASPPQGSPCGCDARPPGPAGRHARPAIWGG